MRLVGSRNQGTKKELGPVTPKNTYIPVNVQSTGYLKYLLSTLVANQEFLELESSFTALLRTGPKNSAIRASKVGTRSRKLAMIVRNQR
ncbi:hypothetical protein CPSG_01669 [Coccidioides posadasii str. Silveira]|uniref:Uncharacterized protein n=1 Tax=Coccidioides posadasii (strain RMSCC 757 / Silveira) TaxID=443226 RepID=E9CW36_COCPS|nr:hypothetical protein CPSG_01669 [Coccidioides posadasii str. Silveira]